MDAVKSFNQELSSLYEIKPPISKAKMTAITKGAIRAIKYYKHVVQSVEKFIQKCRQEYKIPGLYVIDSIVRQSRHQFGPDKDVFAPRFAKNVRVTFYNLYKCPEEEKSKVIRVLNLWQKNEVFPSEVIQPLFDLANPNSELSKQMDEQAKRGLISGTGEKPGKTASIQIAPETQTLTRQPSLQQSDDQGDQHLLQQLQTIQHLLKNHTSASDQVKFNKKLLDFDYSDDEDGGNENDSRPTAAVLDVLQTVLSSDQLLRKLKSMGEINDNQIQQLQQLIPQFQPQQQQQQQPFIRVSPQVASIYSGGDGNQAFSQFGASGYSMTDPSQGMSMWGAPPQPVLIDDIAEDDIQILEDRAGNTASSWRRDGRARSRSGSHERRRRGRRSRSKSRDRNGRRRRSRSPRDRKESERDREKKREREKKGLPPTKRNCLSVCSTTLWVGHLSKLVGDDDLSDMFGEFGAIESINLIPPRGCAFICMNRRQDAARCLRELNKTKMHGKTITIAWAPGKCMKEKQWKDYWDVEYGVSYIPYEKLDPHVNLVDLEEGGTFDEETIPDWMKHMRSASMGMPVTSSTSAPVIAPNMLPDMSKLTGPQPGFVRMPEGMSPAIGGQADPTQIPVPGGPPPGLPPFGLPPGLAQAGLLPGPVLPPAGLLGPPGAPRLVGPPGILLSRFGLPHQPPPLAGHPPPGFPPHGFDISQPPPGLRPPFAHVGQPLGGVVSEAGSDDMDIDQDVTPSQPPLVAQDRNRGGADRRDRNRESRWNRDDKPSDGASNDSLMARLRSLAGQEPEDGRKPPEVWESGAPSRGPSFGRNEAPFGSPGAGPRFGGPQQGGRFPNDDPGFNGGFRNGPPPFPNGGAPFRDGPPPPFGGPPPDSPFGQEFGGRGGRGNFWRGGRGARGGPQGRGGFRDRGGIWMDEAGGSGPTGPDGPFEGFAPDRDGPQGRGRGRGGWRGGHDGGFDRPEPFDRNHRPDFERRERDFDRDRRGGRDRHGRDDDERGGRERSFDESRRDRDGDRRSRDRHDGDERRGRDRRDNDDGDERRGRDRRDNDDGDERRRNRRERKSRWGTDEAEVENDVERKPSSNVGNVDFESRMANPENIGFETQMRNDENVELDREAKNPGNIENDKYTVEDFENRTAGNVHMEFESKTHNVENQEIDMPMSNAESAEFRRTTPNAAFERRTPEETCYDASAPEIMHDEYDDVNAKQTEQKESREHESYFENDSRHENDEDSNREVVPHTDWRFGNVESSPPRGQDFSEQPHPDSPMGSESQRDSDSRFVCNESESSHHDSLYDNDSRQEFVRCESRPDTEDDAARHGHDSEDAPPPENRYEEEQRFPPQEHFVQQEQQPFEQHGERFEPVADEQVQDDSNYSESRTFESESTFREDFETAEKSVSDAGFEPEESSLQQQPQEEDSVD